MSDSYAVTGASPRINRMVNWRTSKPYHREHRDTERTQGAGYVGNAAHLG